jgi:dihydropteroate synthase
VSGAATSTETWVVGVDRTISLGEPRLMGIVNVTPDSFSDGGELPTTDAAITRAMTMIDEGAELIDIGGESTRPGAAAVDAAEQIRRTAGIVRGLRDRSDVVISIDTTCAAVARSALDEGAHVINDTSAGLEDPAMLPLAAERGCGLILMHRRGRPAGERYSYELRPQPGSGDVVEMVCGHLRDRAAAAAACGVDASRLVLDPGLGFGKTVEENLQLIARVREVVDLGYPVLGAASRKSFLGAVTGVESPRGRVAASTAASCVQYLGGVRLFRVHDVAAHRQALLVTRAVEAASKGESHGAAR